MSHEFEIGPIRPPSEAESLLVRVTRGCNWNKCKFCGLYKDDCFSMRPVNDVLEDVRNLAKIKSNHQYISCFLQDADAFVLSADKLLPIVKEIKEHFPQIQFVSTYARADSILRKTAHEMFELKKSGLNHLYIGMETGSDTILSFVNKGVTAKQIIDAGIAAKKAGMIVSVFTLFGIGGKQYSDENAIMTAQALNAIQPQYIRVHAAAIKPKTELGNLLDKGLFQLLSEDEIMLEQKLLLQNLDETDSVYVNEHGVNLVLEVRGTLFEKNRMLETINRYFDMDKDTRTIFALGRRLNVFFSLEDINNIRLKARVENYLKQLNLQEHFDFDIFCNYMRDKMI